MWKILFVVLLSFFASHSSGQQSLSECVQKKWHYVSAKDEQGKDFKKVAATDILSIKTYDGKNKFRYDIAQENIHASGTWELKDSTLVFTYSPKPTDVDTTKRAVRYFKITECFGQRMVFVEKGITFTFSSTEKK
jgi:hypothetical protein